MLDYIKTIGIILIFLAGFASVIAVISAARQSGSENNFYDNQY